LQEKVESIYDRSVNIFSGQGPIRPKRASGKEDGHVPGAQTNITRPSHVVSYGIDVLRS